MSKSEKRGEKEETPVPFVSLLIPQFMYTFPCQLTCDIVREEKKKKYKISVMSTYILLGHDPLD